MGEMFTGSGVALVTPFSEGKIDWEALEKLVFLHLEEGTDAILPCGTTGEPSTMTTEEKDSVVAFVVEKVRGKIPVIAGSGSNNTADAVAASKRCQDLGADGVLVVTPYYNKATQEGLELHYRRIADAIDIPVLMYNVPSRTGLNMLPETAARLAEHPNIGGLKEASGNLAQIVELFRLTRGKLPIYSGNDDQAYALMALGGMGVVSVCANVVPAAMHALTGSYLRGDTVESLAIQEDLAPLIAQLFTEVNPIPVKAALSYMGIVKDELRLPLTPLSEEYRPQLLAEMTKLGLTD